MQSTSTAQRLVKQQTARVELLGILMESSVRHGKFELSSGGTSDLYVDAKRTTSNPRAALLLGEIGWELVKRRSAELRVHVDAIGGLTMGADWIALSVAIAAQLENRSNKIRVFSVRKTPKKHGLQKRIEGNFEANDSVVIVEDVMTTGGSALQAIEAIEEGGGRIAFVLVFVDRQEGGREAIESRGHSVVSIFTRADLALDCRGEAPNLPTA